MINLCKTNLPKAKYFMLLLLVFVSLNAFSQYSIKKFSINNGGGVSSGTEFKVSGSIGQSDASSALTGGNFKLTGGFWANGTNSDIIFKNGFE